MNWGDAACMFNWIMLVVLAVHDLERTAQRLGDWFCLRFSSYGRPFPGAIHCLAHTDFGFLELSTVEDYRQITKTDLGRMLADFLEKNEGVFSAALETRDIWKVAENCRKEGASVSTPKRSETVLNFRRTEGSPVQISDSSSVGAGEQERHTDREEVQKYFGLKLTPVETIPLPLPPCFRQWPVCADRRDGCRSPGRGCGLLDDCRHPGTDPVPGGGSGPCSGENLLEKGFGAVYMDGPFPSDRAHVPGCSWADPFLALSGMLSFVAVIAVAWLLYVHRMEG